MPWKSKKQQAWGHSPSGVKALGGEGKLKEWDDSTDFSHLPNRVAKKKKNWMAAESKREEHAGTKGTFSAAAQRAGESTREFAEEKKHAAGKTGKRARMALMYMGSRH